MKKRLALTVAAITAVATLTLGSPAYALLWIWVGPYPAKAACDVERAEFANTYITQQCLYRDLTGTLNDGWYFKYAPEF
ncbi:hypothetical protein GA0070216_1371 [Micromonospora matsumotoense]|uniref:Uncharacterized protein n=1 Tax=Micromonospora matsumotoense TaxID=121616 RepID=A0A1C5AXA3_9ACTN|nr:hypothetical protein [Micromonospora matsumotoense]SCF49674.1 hypothetical protein GA0070216_1371 [Micromonospora matsumotoense]